MRRCCVHVLRRDTPDQWRKWKTNKRKKDTISPAIANANIVLSWRLLAMKWNTIQLVDSFLKDNFRTICKMLKIQ
ncbi:hypothetical protein ScPMuIL_006634 [Solemya velum]